ncbi:NAD(P)-binding domain-containing protein [Falsiruegeria mediterranea]|uniref:Pyrroline-5-carboxylate reductase n=1 Tax=Falsiruegeria mediterranea M17 TaxID=1200281 RepID=A0A2R8C6Y8_9RHOB|nr:NAD(P)-binding domain-containing protein [Falsiruegeria mediterranea]SPJ28126.1 Pyrroline-5-carboxylate reductase [Falsiruegeria mediterranea M17]
MRIGILGTGTIATAVVRGIVHDGHQIVVSERSQANAQALSQEFAAVSVVANQEVLDQSDVVILGLMPDVARALLPDLRFRDGQSVISLMAEVPKLELAGLVAPAKVEGIAIPFPAIAQGGSPVLCCPASSLMHDLFGANNHVISVNSAADLEAFLSAQAILSPAVKQLALTRDWLAAKTGEAGEAERFLRLLVGGGLLAAPLEHEGALDDLLAALGTPGGFNAELRDFLLERGMQQHIDEGLETLFSRFGT